MTQPHLPTLAPVAPSAQEVLIILDRSTATPPPDFATALNEHLIDIQNQAALMIFDRSKSLGTSFSVTRQGETVRCSFHTEDRMTEYCRFTIGPHVQTYEEGSIVTLKLDVTATVAAEFLEAELRLKTLNALMEVARMLDATYCKTWAWSLK